MSRKFITPLPLMMLPAIRVVPKETSSQLVTQAAWASSCLLNSDTFMVAPSFRLGYFSLSMYDLTGSRSR